MKFSDSIFRAYDVRGVFGKDFDLGFAYLLGRAFVMHLKCSNVVVGRDARKSSGPIFKQLIQGVLDQGANVIDLGGCTTPMFYFTVANYSYDGGIMITASHNPAEYNGFKLTKEQAIPIGWDSGLREIKALLKGMHVKPQKMGHIIKKDVIGDYIEHCLSQLGQVKEYKVVADAGNGMASLLVPRVFESLPVQLVPMYFDIDMSFPNHEANPVKFETLRALQQRVTEEGADLGIAFDGDADRVVFIDEKGQVIPGDFTTALIASELLHDEPGAVIVYDLRSSWAVTDMIKAHNGKPHMCRVGYAFIKKEMRKTKAIFAGELSGHFYYRDNFYNESAVISVLKMMELMCRSKKRLSELVDPLREYFQSGEINIPVKDKEAAIRNVEVGFRGSKVSHMDGLKVEGQDFWFNLRPSNTEPVVRFTAEAKTREKLEEIKARVLPLIK